MFFVCCLCGVVIVMLCGELVVCVNCYCVICCDFYGMLMLFVIVWLLEQVMIDGGYVMFLYLLKLMVCMWCVVCGEIVFGMNWFGMCVVLNSLIV